TAEITRRFQMNYAPDTWFSGPDTTLYPRDPVTGERFINFASWRNLSAIGGSMLSCDSLDLWPAERPQRKTFFEVYNPRTSTGVQSNRLYIRSENDTVDMNSWLIFHAGGSDLDSPYDVKVKFNDP